MELTMNFRAWRVALRASMRDSLRVSLRVALLVCAAALACVPVQGWGQGTALEEGPVADGTVAAASGMEEVLESLAIQAAQAT